MSPSTVSRALAGKEGVSEETRARLIEMAMQMGLGPRVDGRHRNGSRSQGAPDASATWGKREISALVLMDSRTNTGLADMAREPFYMELIAALYEGGQRYRTSLQMAPIHDDEMLETALERAFDGVIWVGYNPVEGYEPWISTLRERGIPAILCDHYVAELPCDAVVTDNITGAYDAGEYVGGVLGHRRVGILKQRLPSVASFERTRGYVSGLVASGVSPNDIVIIEEKPSFDGGYRALDQVLDFGATAVLCGNDTMALGVIRRASERGVAVPGALSVVGFDDLSTSSRVTPSLTTVRVDKRMLGLETVRRLFLRIVEQDLDIQRPEGAGSAPIRSLVATMLVRRESTGPRPSS